MTPYYDEIVVADPRRAGGADIVTRPGGILILTDSRGRWISASWDEIDEWGNEHLVEVPASAIVRASRIVNPIPKGSS